MDTDIEKQIHDLHSLFSKIAEAHGMSLWCIKFGSWGAGNDNTKWTATIADRPSTGTDAALANLWMADSKTPCSAFTEAFKKAQSALAAKGENETD
jgi:hypothetical protein